MKPTNDTTPATEQARRLTSICLSDLHARIEAGREEFYQFPRAPEPYTFGDRKDTGRISLGHGAFKTRKLGG